MSCRCRGAFPRSRALISALLFLLCFFAPSLSLAKEGEPAPAKRLSRKERNAAEAAAILELKNAGVSEVGRSPEAAKLRHYQLRKKKRKGLLRRKEADLASVLFPGVAPELYAPNEEVFMYTDMVQSKKTQLPFEFYDLPGCGMPTMTAQRSMHRAKQRRNLGARLQGHELKPAPFVLTVKQDQKCKVLCQVNADAKQVRWVRKLVERQYRVQLTLDQLPVLMRNTQLNYAARGYPVGFVAPPSYTGRKQDEFYLYNHVKFIITYQEGIESDAGGGVYITGFDVHPVSIKHAEDGSTCGTQEKEGPSEVNNDPETYLGLHLGEAGESLPIIYSYEVEWKPSDLLWADRWDIYLLSSPDDNIHFFAIVNSLMIVLFLTGASATIMIRTLKKDISAYNETSLLEESHEETGWKLLHGDVFRAPEHASALAALVGTGAQIGTAFFISMVAAILKLVNPVKKGQTLTALVVMYVLCGCVAGYVAARISKFCNAKQSWKVTTIMTATAAPALLMGIFTILNIFLSFAGAATAVSFLTLLSIFALWVCVSAPLVFLGGLFGYKEATLEVPCKINQIARVVPTQAMYGKPPVSCLLGGILPFGSVCIELYFIMSALWLHQIYYVMGFLLAVMMILAATCAQVSIVMDYLQLCGEDHRWWWKSFCNCASAGLYLFAYSLWFLASRLELVGFLPVLVYLTYMSMISLLFGIFCGSVGFVSSFWFNRNIYGALKVD